MNSVDQLLVFSGVVIGVAIGVLIGAGTVKLSPSEYSQKALEQYRQGIELVSDCEKELPRNKNCEVVLTVKIVEKGSA